MSQEIQSNLSYPDSVVLKGELRIDHNSDVYRKDYIYFYAMPTATPTFSNIIDKMALKFICV